MPSHNPKGKKMTSCQPKPRKKGTQIQQQCPLARLRMKFVHFSLKTFIIGERNYSCTIRNLGLPMVFLVMLGKTVGIDGV